MNQVQIFLPTPDQKLHSHNTGHHLAKAKVIKARRGHAKILMLSAMNKAGIQGRWKKAEISYVFYVPDYRRRDIVNMLQQEKASVDGIVDAKLIVGDHWQALELGTVKVVVRKVKPGTAIVLERLDV